MYASDPLLSDVLLYEMRPGLFIGGWAAAAHACRTEALGPQVVVVNLTNGKPMLSEFGVEIKVDDNGSPEAMHAMEDALIPTLERMKEVIDQQVPVLVHCSAGRQRSAAVVAAYLMKFHGWGPRCDTRLHEKEET
jgi:rhodanese-related sulfurtransferase